jgi:alkylation response protein AidB-like acyl-CoA dehydrogenase
MMDIEWSPGEIAFRDELRAFAASLPSPGRGSLLDDPLFGARIAEARIKVAALEMYELRAMSALSAGRSPGPAASVMKIRGTELRQRITELELDAAGQYGRAYQPQAGRPGGAVSRSHSQTAAVGPGLAALAPLRYLNERAGSIYAGSNEIQRNILAKLILAT